MGSGLIHNVSTERQLSELNKVNVSDALLFGSQIITTFNKYIK